MNNVISGVYIIKNVINGKVYIGSSNNISNRWHLHKKTLNEHKHHNCHLQNAWDKYGEENFNFDILEIVSDINKLIEREQLWMDKYEAYNVQKGYNINPTAGSQLGRKLSDESKLKMIKSNRLRKPIVQLDTKGNFINEFPSIMNTMKEIKISSTSINKSIKNKIFFKGYAFVYKNDYESGEFKNQFNFLQKNDYESIKKDSVSSNKIIGSIGSNRIISSKTKFQELVSISSEKVKQNYKILKLSFLNYQDCEVIVNDEVIFLPTGKGFFVDEKSKHIPITSFIIVQSGIKYYLEGIYSIIKN